MGIFDFLKRNKDNSSFEAKAKELFTQFENHLNAENFKDYPIPYWFDVVKVRADMMKNQQGERSILDVQNEWTWMHADEYSNKYTSQPKKEVIQSISLRIERFGYIYQALCSLETNLKHLVQEYHLNTNPFVEQFDWDKSSAAASLYGSIKFGLSIGMSKSEVKKLYKDFVYNQDLINGADPFAKFGMNSKEVSDFIKDKTGVNVDDIKLQKMKIKQKISSVLSQMDIKKRYAVFTILGLIAQSDGTTEDEHVVLADIALELEIDINEFNNTHIDGNLACDLLQDLDKHQKNELSSFIALLVGADGVFSSDEVIFVKDAIKQLGLDMSLLNNLIEKYWKN